MYLSTLLVNVGDNPDRPRPGRLWLRDVYRVHQRLWMAFPDAERRVADPFFLGAWNGPAIAKPKPSRREAGFLFRIERDAAPRILVQSAQRPDWEYAFQNAPYLLSKPPQVREFDPAPRRDHAYRFRLLVNVVVRRSVVHPNGRTRTTRSGKPAVRKKRAETLVHPEPVAHPLPADPAERKRVLLARWDPWRKWLAHVGCAHGFRVEQPESSLFMEAVHVLVRTARNDTNHENAARKRFNGGLFNGVLVCTDAELLRDAIIAGIGPAKAFGFGLLSVAPVEAAP